MAEVLIILGLVVLNVAVFVAGVRATAELRALRAEQLEIVVTDCSAYEAPAGSGFCA